MRAPTRIVVGLVVGALVVAACDSSTPATSRRPSAQAAPTTNSATATAVTTTTMPTPTVPGVTTAPLREVVIGIDVVPPTLNPFAPGGDFLATTIVAQLHLAGVYDIDGVTRTLVPELVEELPTPSNGGVQINADGTMTVRYRIKDAATWSDGVPVSGDDFQFTLDAIQALGAGNAGTAGRRDIPGDYARIVDSEAGPKTFEFTMAEPTMAYERLFAYVAPEHAVAGTDIVDDWPAADWPAAGPFVLDTYVPGEAVRFVRNEAYWKTDPTTGDNLPHLDGVTLRFLPDVGDLVGAIIDGEVDVISPPVFTEIVDTFSAVGSIEVQDVAGAFWEHVGFHYGTDNSNRASLNLHLAFRQAVAHAMDRKTLARKAGWSAPLSTLQPLSVGTAEGPWSRYVHDPPRARELLAVACAEADRDCVVDPPQLVYSTTAGGASRPALAGALGEMLEDIGIEFVLQLEDSELFFEDTLPAGSWDVGGWAWVHRVGMQGALTTMEIFDPAEPPPEGNNYYRWGTLDSTVAGDPAPELMRELLDRARHAADPTEVAAIYNDVEQLLADNVVVIPIAARRSLLAVRTDHVAGVIHNPTDAGFTWNVEMWSAP